MLIERKITDYDRFNKDLRHEGQLAFTIRAILLAFHVKSQVHCKKYWRNEKFLVECSDNKSDFLLLDFSIFSVFGVAILVISSGVLLYCNNVSDGVAELLLGDTSIVMTDEYSVQSRRGLCVKTGQLRVELIALKVV
jgi:hypothetical protein